MDAPINSCHTLPWTPERRGPSLEGKQLADIAAMEAAQQTAAILLVTPPKMLIPTLPKIPAYID